MAVGWAVEAKAGRQCREGSGRRAYHRLTRDPRRPRRSHRCATHRESHPPLCNGRCGPVDQLVVGDEVQLTILIHVQVEGHGAGRLVAAYQLEAQVVIILEVQGNDEVHLREGQQVETGLGDQEETVGGHGETRQRDGLLKHALVLARVADDEYRQAAEGGARRASQFHILVKVCTQAGQSKAPISPTPAPRLPTTGTAREGAAHVALGGKGHGRLRIAGLTVEHVHAGATPRVLVPPVRVDAIHASLAEDVHDSALKEHLHRVVPVDGERRGVEVGRGAEPGDVVRLVILRDHADELALNLGDALREGELQHRGATVVGGAQAVDREIGDVAVHVQL
eukprot:scaffold7225_cov379-Prasinococcus_capsulatus_cf.AAC.16